MRRATCNPRAPSSFAFAARGRCITSTRSTAGESCRTAGCSSMARRNGSGGRCAGRRLGRHRARTVEPSVLVLFILFVTSTAAAGCRARSTADGRNYGLGHAATQAEIAARDIDVGPDGVGLPSGSGSVARGETIYAAQCASCHGASGEGRLPIYPRLVGRDSIAEGFRFGQDPRLVRTIGNYWPYATTLF